MEAEGAKTFEHLPILYELEVSITQARLLKCTTLSVGNAFIVMVARGIPLFSTYASIKHPLFPTREFATLQRAL